MFDAKNRSTIGLGIQKTNFDFFQSKNLKINGLSILIFDRKFRARLDSIIAINFLGEHTGDHSIYLWISRVQSVKELYFSFEQRTGFLLSRL